MVIIKSNKIFVIILIQFIGCNFLEVENEAGIVKSKIIIESNLDSIKIKYNGRIGNDNLDTAITHFPWIYDYSDFLTSPTSWYIEKVNKSGYLKISFMYGDVYDIDNLVLRDSIKYDTPSQGFIYNWKSEKQINYYLSILNPTDSLIFKIGYDASWSEYDIDSNLYNNSFILNEFRSQYYKYKGLIINPTSSIINKLEFRSSGSNGQKYYEQMIPPNDTIKFNISEGIFSILK